MKRAKLTSVINGVTIDVHATTDHPCSSYGQPVWVDDDGHAFLQVGLEEMAPWCQVTNIIDDGHDE